MKTVRYKNIEQEKEINSNKAAQQEIADVEFAKEEEYKKINPNQGTKVDQDVNVQKNFNHIRQRQLY